MYAVSVPNIKQCNFISETKLKQTELNKTIWRLMRVDRVMSYGSLGSCRKTFDKWLKLNTCEWKDIVANSLLRLCMVIVIIVSRIQ